MKPTHVKPTRYGELRLEPGARYKVVREFRDYDFKVHAVGEEWVFRGYDVLPYNDGHTLYVHFDAAGDGVIRLQWHVESQASILESFETYVVRAQQIAARDAGNPRA
jgi:hypothetical protein